VLKEIHEAEKNDMEFTPQPVPDPTIALEEKS
jgi:hypothetical protein